MQIYKAPVTDFMFLLNVFDYNEVHSWEAFRDYDIETVQMLIEQIGAFATERMLPLNRVGDVQGVQFNPEDNSVKTPDGFKEAYADMVKQGYLGLLASAEYGGGAAPAALGPATMEMATATNKSLSMYMGLTQGLVHALTSHATDAQKKDWLPKLISGEWTGTMCLTEPHCGTDLGMLRTKAVKDGDNYRISGTKIWITSGEHDLAENIVHFVLARTPDAPPGIKGISVFIVPKVTLDGERNSVYCTGLEHKMGINGSPTCVISLEEAEGYLVGDLGKGMRVMFTMMNEARLHVGVEGIALSEIAYQTALAFAKDRRQGRSLNPERNEEGQAADNILVHPDVRRMLLNIKSTTEGMRALGVWIGALIDHSHHNPSEEERQKADDLVQLLTPIAKSYFTERGFLNVSDAMQVCGGSGYTTDWSIEQYLRDVRIAMIYEGTNHIQALDLVGRKLPRHGGRLLQTFSGELTTLIRESKDIEGMAEFIDPLKAASKQLTDVTMQLATRGMQDMESAAAVASNYLNLFALTTLAYVWCRQVKAVFQTNPANAETKLKTARYFMTMVLPERESLAQKVLQWKGNIMDFDVDEF